MAESARQTSQLKKEILVRLIKAYCQFTSNPA